MLGLTRLCLSALLLIGVTVSAAEPATKTPVGKGTPQGAVCGARGAPDACPEGQYCNLTNCGRADEGGHCAPRPEICTRIYMPVCGCDGKTYGNACDAAAAGVSVESEGECATANPTQCGGIAGLPCPEGQVCVDDPNDDCDPERGGADCSGLCKPPRRY